MWDTFIAGTWVGQYHDGQDEAQARQKERCMNVLLGMALPRLNHTHFEELHILLSSFPYRCCPRPQCPSPLTSLLSHPPSQFLLFLIYIHKQRDGWMKVLVLDRNSLYKGLSSPQATNTSTVALPSTFLPLPLSFPPSLSCSIPLIS